VEEVRLEGPTHFNFYFPLGHLSIISIQSLIHGYQALFFFHDEGTRIVKRIFDEKNKSDFGTNLFGIFEDHKRYPIWSCRQAVLTFLMGEISNLHKDIKPMIAKLVCETRRDREIWWKDEKIEKE
jgi:hypothetical protein